MISFRDGELEATLPDAIAVYHVDADGWPIPGHVKRVDWAWGELSRYFLCELKDPECAGALKHDPGASARMKTELAGPSFPGELANKAYQTVQHHPPTSAAPTRVYVVVAAIASLTAAEMGTAGLVVQREMARLGSSMSAIVVNIAEWNAQLAPRSITRK